MAQKTKRQAALEAARNTADFEENTNKNMRFVVQHMATIISLITVILFVVLYAYYEGYYRVFNIPVNYAKIELRSYLPFMIQFCGIFIYLSSYYSAFKTDEILRRKRINFVRIFNGISILLYLFRTNNMKGKGYILFAVLIPILTELWIKIIKLHKKDKVVDEIEYKFLVEDYIDANIKRLIYKKSWIIVICILAAPLWGGYKAKARNEYEIASIDNQQYAIIVDYQDSAVVQKIKEKDIMVL